jgi:hypothetical protein
MAAAAPTDAVQAPLQVGEQPFGLLARRWPPAPGRGAGWSARIQRELMRWSIEFSR